MPIYPIHLSTYKTKPDGYPAELNTIGDHIKKRRLDLELSKAKLAQQLNLNVLTITEWETNVKRPLISSMPKIVSFLGYVPLIGVDKNSLRGHVLSYRMTHGLSQTKLAKMICIDAMAIPNLEKNKNILPKYVERIEEFLFEKE